MAGVAGAFDAGSVSRHWRDQSAPPGSSDTPRSPRRPARGQSFWRADDAAAQAGGVTHWDRRAAAIPARRISPFWFQRLPEANALYLQFNQVFHKSDENLEQFSDRLRMVLAGEPGVRNLILDLRHNNGGNTHLYPPLLRTLVAFEERPGTRVYALIGRYTYSAASNFIVDLERLTDVTFVGEPSGGKPNTLGDESPATLPCSGLSGGLSSVYWQLSSPRDERAWIAPDIPVALRGRLFWQPGSSA